MARVRRDPVAAREHILAAAERVLAELGPDRAGLKEIATAAGVSHGLVTHYFGTYDALVDAVLEARLIQIRSRLMSELIAAGPAIALDPIIDRLIDVLAEPITLRLTAWAFLSGRFGHRRLSPARARPLRKLVDVLEAALHATGNRVTRPDLEFAVVASAAIMLGYQIAGSQLLSSLGRSPSADVDHEFRLAWLTMIRDHLRRLAVPAKGDS